MSDPVDTTQLAFEIVARVRDEAAEGVQRVQQTTARLTELQQVIAQAADPTQYVQRWQDLASAVEQAAVRMSRSMRDVSDLLTRQAQLTEQVQTMQERLAAGATLWSERGVQGGQSLVAALETKRAELELIRAALSGDGVPGAGGPSGPTPPGGPVGPSVTGVPGILLPGDPGFRPMYQLPNSPVLPGTYAPGAARPAGLTAAQQRVAYATEQAFLAAPLPEAAQAEIDAMLQGAVTRRARAVRTAVEAADGESERGASGSARGGLSRLFRGEGGATMLAGPLLGTLEPELAQVGMQTFAAARFGMTATALGGGAALGVGLASAGIGVIALTAYMRAAEQTAQEQAKLNVAVAQFNVGALASELDRGIQQLALFEERAKSFGGTVRSAVERSWLFVTGQPSPEEFTATRAVEYGRLYPATQGLQELMQGAGAVYGADAARAQFERQRAEYYARTGQTPEEIARFGGESAAAITRGAGAEQQRLDTEAERIRAQRTVRLAQINDQIRRITEAQGGTGERQQAFRDLIGAYQSGNYSEEVLQEIERIAREAREGAALPQQAEAALANVRRSVETGYSLQLEALSRQRGLIPFRADLERQQSREATARAMFERWQAQRTGFLAGDEAAAWAPYGALTQGPGAEAAGGRFVEQALARTELTRLLAPNRRGGAAFNVDELAPFLRTPSGEFSPEAEAFLRGQGPGSPELLQWIRTAIAEWDKYSEAMAKAGDATERWKATLPDERIANTLKARANITVDVEQAQQVREAEQQAGGARLGVERANVSLLQARGALTRHEAMLAELNIRAREIGLRETGVGLLEERRGDLGTQVDARRAAYRAENPHLTEEQLERNLLGPASGELGKQYRALRTQRDVLGSEIEVSQLAVQRDWVLLEAAIAEYRAIREPLAGFKKGLTKEANRAGDWERDFKQVMRATAEGATEAFTDGFFTVMTGEFDALGRVVENFGRTFVAAVGRTLAEEAAAALFSRVRQALGFASESTGATGSEIAWLFRQGEASVSLRGAMPGFSQALP